MCGTDNLLTRAAETLLPMSESTLDRETMLDLLVNIVPLAIIVFFAILFLVVEPWGTDLFIQAISLGLLVVPFLVLALVSYVSGSAVARDEAGGGGVATDGTLSSTDAELEGNATEENEADDDDYSMVEDQIDAEPDDAEDE